MWGWEAKSGQWSEERSDSLPTVDLSVRSSLSCGNGVKVWREGVKGKRNGHLEPWDSSLDFFFPLRGNMEMGQLLGAEKIKGELSFYSAGCAVL